MIRLRIVGDGERDAATLPPLLRGILATDFEHTPTPWPRLNRWEQKIKGYSLKVHGRKLLYVLTDARQRGFDGVAASVDTDRSTRGEKLKQMKLAREADRTKAAPLPAALGEATPHNEAWLLDDQVAVREGLQLPADATIPDVRPRSYPKTTLQELHQQSPRADEDPLQVWPDIAARVDGKHCNHKGETGFAAFVSEVKEELGPLFAQAG